MKKELIWDGHANIASCCLTSGNKKTCINNPLHSNTALLAATQGIPVGFGEANYNFIWPSEGFIIDMVGVVKM